MSFRRSQANQQTSSSTPLWGTYQAVQNAESTPLIRYGPPPPSSLGGMPSSWQSPSGLRRILVSLGLLWIGGVAYLASLGGSILRGLEEQRSLSAGQGPGAAAPLAAERLAPAMGGSPAAFSSSSSAEAVEQLPRQHGGDGGGGFGGESSASIGSDAMGTSSASTGTSATSSGTSGNNDGSLVHRHSKTSLSAENVTVLVVYGPEYHSYISAYAWQVALGVNSAFKKHARAVTGRIVFGNTANLTFLNVLDADAVLIGSPVYNGNTHPDVQGWINYWHIESDLSRKIGGAFVTAGGMHSGAEGTLMSLMRSMMVFRMMTVGGDSWNSPFGAVATMHEDPFGDTRRSYDFNSSCYQTDTLIHPHFLRKAWDFGERVANVTFALKNSTLWNMWG